MSTTSTEELSAPPVESVPRHTTRSEIEWQAVADNRESRPTEPDPTGSRRTMERADRVDISQAARQLAADGTTR